MKVCPHCQSKSPSDSKFCQQCGRALEASTPHSDATVLMSATQLAARGPVQQTFDVPALLGSKSRLVIGRAPDCDIFLAHPSVSRYHALLERRDDALYVSDLGSVNGVWLGGHRVTEAAAVREGDRVGIGPFLLSLTHGVLHSLDNSRSLRLEARGLEKIVVTTNRTSRKLLDNINLVVNPGEFVTLLGPSGSGKSTLMDCLNGRRRATSGLVLANGEDFYRHFDSFRQSLGYVPQKDIVHTQLTVSRALLYTARLRLPLDTDPDELHARVESVLKEMELFPHRDTLIGDLSGGQIKRVSLGAELLGQPALLYIDEATSGLDAGTEARMMRLFRGLADVGRSIICITHNVDNVDQCHLVLVLARGKVVYYGPPREAPRYFQVARISNIYDRLAERDLAEWEKDFRESALYREFVAERLAMSASSGRIAAEVAANEPGPGVAPPVADASGSSEEPVAPRSRLAGLLSDSRKLMEHFTPLAEQFRQIGTDYLRWRERLRPVLETWHQFRVLTHRYVELVLGDRRGLRLLALQAPIVALFLLVGFIHKEYTQTMPLLRHLTANERETLLVMRGLDLLLDENRPLMPDQREALAKIKVQVAGVPVPLDGNRLVDVLRRLQREDLNAVQKTILEEVYFSVTIDGYPVEINAARALEAWRQFHRSRIPEQLLKMGSLDEPVVPSGEGINPRYTYILLFILAMIVMWFGCNNAAKEIVKEEAIYGRERAVNLRILPYLASKFVVLSAITAIHALLLMLLLFGTLELLAYFAPGHSVPPAEHMLAYPAQLGVMVLLAMTGVALGLLLSACVATPDRANTLLPYVLIPQMILGGGIMSVNTGPLYYLAVTLSPVYWAYRAVHLGASALPAGYPGHTNYSDGVGLPCLALVVQMTVLLVMTAWFLKRKDA
jgi:ABC-type multidrug transport system ATPase subunit